MKKLLTWAVGACVVLSMQSCFESDATTGASDEGTGAGGEITGVSQNLEDLSNGPLPGDPLLIPTTTSNAVTVDEEAKTISWTESSSYCMDGESEEYESDTELKYEIQGDTLYTWMPMNCKATAYTGGTTLDSKWDKVSGEVDIPGGADEDCMDFGLGGMEELMASMIPGLAFEGSTFEIAGSNMINTSTMEICFGEMMSSGLSGATEGASMTSTSCNQVNVTGKNGETATMEVLKVSDGFQFKVSSGGEECLSLIQEGLMAPDEAQCGETAAVETAEAEADACIAEKMPWLDEAFPDEEEDEDL